MTLPRYYAVAERWKKVPPLSSSVACIAMALGAKPAAQQAPKPDGGSGKEAQMQELFELLGGNGFDKGVPEWLKETTSR
jgi:hypothetical protein